MCSGEAALLGSCLADNKLEMSRFKAAESDEWLSCVHLSPQISQFLQVDHWKLISFIKAWVWRRLLLVLQGQDASWWPHGTSLAFSFLPHTLLLDQKTKTYHHLNISCAVPTQYPVHPSLSFRAVCKSHCCHCLLPSSNRVLSGHPALTCNTLTRHIIRYTDAQTGFSISNATYRLQHWGARQSYLWNFDCQIAKQMILWYAHRIFIRLLWYALKYGWVVIWHRLQGLWRMTHESIWKLLSDA